MSGSYRKAIEAIALNDEPLEMDVEAMAGMASVMVVAVAFDKDQDKVAADVIRFREKNPA
jgi:hypothetical protein